MYKPSLIARINELTLRAIVATKTPPPQTARILAIVHTCAYDAWAMWQPHAQSTRTMDFRRFQNSVDYEKEVEEAIAFAAYRALDAYFGQKVRVEMGDKMLETFMEDNGYAYANTTLDPAVPAGLGNLCAAAVLDHRRGDGAVVDRA